MYPLPSLPSSKHEYRAGAAVVTVVDAVDVSVDVTEDVAVDRV